MIFEIADTLTRIATESESIPRLRLPLLLAATLAALPSISEIPFLDSDSYFQFHL